MLITAYFVTRKRDISREREGLQTCGQPLFFLWIKMCTKCGEVDRFPQIFKRRTDNYANGMKNYTRKKIYTKTIHNVDNFIPRVCGKVVNRGKKDCYF